VPYQTLHLLAGLRIPKAHGIVLATRKDPFPIRGEGHGIHSTPVTFQAEQFLARLQHPQTDRSVSVAFGRGEREATIRGKGHGGYAPFMSLKAPHQPYLLGNRLGRWGQCAPTGLYLLRAERAVIDGNLVDEPAEEAKVFRLPDGQGGIRIGYNHIDFLRSDRRSVHVNGEGTPASGNC